jgi:hypothetical protein
MPTPESRLLNPKIHLEWETTLSRFDSAYPNIDPNEDVGLLDILNNGHNTKDDVIWMLRATKQNSRYISFELARRCCHRMSIIGCCEVDIGISLSKDDGITGVTENFKPDFENIGNGFVADNIRRCEQHLSYWVARHALETTRDAFIFANGYDGELYNKDVEYYFQHKDLLELLS